MPMADDDDKHPDPEPEDDKHPDPEDDGFVEAVTKIVKDVVSDLVGKPDPEKSDPEPPKKDAPASPRQQEADTEGLVRRLLSDAKRDEEHQAEHKKLKELAEKPPRHVSRITRFMWGAGDDS